MDEKRTSPGRPRVRNNEKTQPYTISLTPSEVRVIRKLGGGNLTAGIRKAIDNMTATVTNRNSKQIDFDAAVNMMDDDIREQLHNRQEWQSNQDFFAAYETAHEEKYGEEWELSKSNPVW